MLGKILSRTMNWARSRMNGLESPSPYARVDPTAIIGPGAFLDVRYRPLEPRECVWIGAHSQIFCRFVILRPGGSIRIGERSQLGGSLFVSACGIEVGDDVLMAWDCTIMDNDSHSIHWDQRKNDVLQCERDFRTTPEDFSRNKDWSVVPMAPVRIGNKVWIGFGVSILKGVTIGEGAVIGAGSVVTRDVAPFSVNAGNPCRVMHTL